jgi:DNA-binding NtrC family response regulator
MDSVLVVDDDESVRQVFIERLKAGGFNPLEASNGFEAIKILKKSSPVTVFLDLKMPGMDGIETLRKIKSIDSNIPVIIVTGHGDIPAAVESIKLGAYDFIVKPPRFNKLLLTARRAIEKYKLEENLKRLNASMDSSLEYLLGKSPAMKKVIDQINEVAWTDYSLIIQGETGSGKTFIARAIHNLSKRSDNPFVVVDVGAIPETLVESELFGHEKGAFTGAEKKKKGFFEISNNGTLLFDELQNMPPYVQRKLLTAVEEKQVSPVGSTKPLKIDTRIIGTSNSDIIEAVKVKKTFREDLYYRLSEYEIEIPPLRERIEDIAFFANKFYSEASEDLGKQIHGISDDAYAVLADYSWPGNVRELKNVVKRAVLSSNRELKPEHIKIASDNEAGSDIAMLLPDNFSGLTMHEIEKMVIKRTLDMTGNNKSKTATILNINYKTLLRKIEKGNLYN